MGLLAGVVIGEFYAQTVIERIGRADGGVVRIGCSCYTTMHEVERLLEELRHLAKTEAR